ncbi:MAG: hypothetical protein ACJAZN_001726 [Planctomycetota bacterium]|jgi:hypothetical protein
MAVPVRLIAAAVPDEFGADVQYTVPRPDAGISKRRTEEPPFSIGRDGLALQKGTHLMRLYCSTPELLVHGVRFTLTAEAPERD